MLRADCSGRPLATAVILGGISCRAAYLRRDGATVRDRKGSVRHVDRQLPLAPNRISPTFFGGEERTQIVDLASHNLGPTVIGEIEERSSQTINRELRRNRHYSDLHRPFHPYVQAAERQRPRNPIKIETTKALRRYASSRLAKKWYTKQISRPLRAANPKKPGMCNAPESS